MIARNHLKSSLLLSAVLILLANLFQANLAYARQETPTHPEYIVQDGDTLWGIAARFGVTLAELQNLNTTIDAGALRVGDRLQIPGLDGLSGVISTAEASFGDTVRGLERSYRIPSELFIRLNRLSSPNDLFAGATLILPDLPADQPPPSRAEVLPGRSLLDLAVLNNANPWTLVQDNSLSGAWSPLPGDVLVAPTTSSNPNGSSDPSGLPEWIGPVVIDPLSLLQGKAALISVASSIPDLTLSGTLLDHPLNFFPDGKTGLAALQGVHAMTEPGLYPLELHGSLPDGRSFDFSQMVPLKAVNYPLDIPLAVDPATIDPAVTQPEDAQWSALSAPVTSERLWNGIFKLPSPFEQAYCLETGECWTSRFGNRRSYNGSPYQYFHTGLDIAGQTGTEIFAPADGLVVFAGPLTVRGNATMINHGQGVYTGYMHQSEIFVKPGETVSAGQLIGKVGGTGRVQGPHLHWEIWVGGVQVDPLDWLERAYP